MLCFVFGMQCRGYTDKKEMGNSMGYPGISRFKKRSRLPGYCIKFILSKSNEMYRLFFLTILRYTLYRKINAVIKDIFFHKHVPTYHAACFSEFSGLYLFLLRRLRRELNRAFFSCFSMVKMLK